VLRTVVPCPPPTHRDSTTPPINLHTPQERAYVLYHLERQADAQWKDKGAWSFKWVWGCYCSAPAACLWLVLRSALVLIVQI